MSKNLAQVTPAGYLNKFSKEKTMAEEIETIDVDQTYASTMDSVNLINRIYDKGINGDEDLELIDRNKKHLEIMLGKEFWTVNQDLEPIRLAVDRKE